MTRIVIVTGHMAECYEDLRAAYPDLITTIHNPRYQDSGSLFSLCCARTLLDDDFLLLESDLVYETRALTACFDCPDRSSTAIAAPAARATRRSSRLTRRAFSWGSRKTAAGLALVCEARWWVSRRYRSYLFRRLLDAADARFSDTLQLNYETDGFAGVALDSPIRCVLVPDLAWTEIDDARQLARAETMVFPAIVAREQMSSSGMNGEHRLFDWHAVWTRKGLSLTTDLREVDGYEETAADLPSVASHVAACLDLQPSDRLLEVGCGAGALTPYLNCDYVGVDYAWTMVERHRKSLGNRVAQATADALCFVDGAFDKAFAFGVLHYLPDKAHVWRCVDEMKRVTRGTVFIGDLPMRSHRVEHLLFRKEEFAGATGSPGCYTQDRFNVLLRGESTSPR